MKEITRYQADDGSIWENQVDAVIRDDHVAAINKAMAPLGERPTSFEFNNGKCYVRHDRAVVIAVTNEMIRVGKIVLDDSAQKYLGYIGRENQEVHLRDTVLSRIIDDRGGPFAVAWSRLMNIDDKGREWGQQFYARNPPRSAKEWKGASG